VWDIVVSDSIVHELYTVFSTIVCVKRLPIPTLLQLLHNATRHRWLRTHGDKCCEGAAQSGGSSTPSCLYPRVAHKSPPGRAGLLEFCTVAVCSAARKAYTAVVPTARFVYRFSLEKACEGDSHAALLPCTGVEHSRFAQNCGRRKPECRSAFAF
jgi:hypothetical protein